MKTYPFKKLGFIGVSPFPIECLFEKSKCLADIVKWRTDDACPRTNKINAAGVSTRNCYANMTIKPRNRIKNSLTITTLYERLLVF